MLALKYRLKHKLRLVTELCLEDSDNSKCTYYAYQNFENA
jgi:hypothetical protein